MESKRNGLLPPTELQCLPEKNVGRRSVEVTQVVEEFFGPSDESGEWMKEVHIATSRSPGCARNTDCILVSPDCENGSEDSIEQLTKEIKFPEFTEQNTIMETEMHEPHKETNQPQHTGGSSVSAMQNANAMLGDKASQGPLSKKKADGYEAAFHHNKIRGAGKLSSFSAMSSPTESLEDLLYRKTKRVFDYSVVDMKGQRAGQYSTIPSECVSMPLIIHCSSGAPSFTYTKRIEHTVTQSRIVRRKEDNQHSLQVNINKAWVEPERSNCSSRVSTQKGNTASCSQPIQKSSDIIRKEKKSAYYIELNQQVQERQQMIERERSRNVDAERKHNETMQFGLWGKPGSGAPNPSTVRRTKFSSTGLMCQDQIPYKGFAGIPFHLRF